jgi:LPXTG-motif cell wall-anchored protein
MAQVAPSPVMAAIPEPSEASTAQPAAVRSFWPVYLVAGLLFAGGAWAWTRRRRQHARIPPH